MHIDGFIYVGVVDGVCDNVERLQRRLTTREGGEDGAAGGIREPSLMVSRALGIGVCRAQSRLGRADSSIEAYVTLWSMS